MTHRTLHVKTAAHFSDELAIGLQHQSKTRVMAACSPARHQTPMSSLQAAATEMSTAHSREQRLEPQQEHFSCFSILVINCVL